MNSLKNSVRLIGNIGKNPEIRTFESGKKQATFSLATNEQYKNENGDKVEATQWHNLVAWNKASEIIEKYTKKGSEIAIEGKLVTRSYETESGEKRYVTEVHVSEILLLGKKSKD